MSFCVKIRSCGVGLKDAAEEGLQDQEVLVHPWYSINVFTLYPLPNEGCPSTMFKGDDAPGAGPGSSCQASKDALDYPLPETLIAMLFTSKMQWHYLSEIQMPCSFIFGSATPQHVSVHRPRANGLRAWKETYFQSSFLPLACHNWSSALFCVNTN